MALYWLVMIGPWLLALGLLLAGAAPVDAQPGAGAPTNPSDFTNNPHPAMPWAPNSPTRIDYGTLVQYIPVPPQQVSITVYVPVPEGVPPRTEQQIVEVPGYYVAETTTGFYYPERWTLQQLNVGVYQWVKLPPDFRRK